MSSETTPRAGTWASIWRISWPLIVSMFLNFSVGLGDVYVAGRFGPDVQGAIGFAGQLLWFFTVFANAVGVGLVALVARDEGSGNVGGVRAVSNQGFLLGVMIGGALSVLGVVASPSPEGLTFLPRPVAAVSSTLLPWYGASVLPQTLLVVATSLFRARGRVIGILTCSLVTALLNLVGDFALSFGWWGFPEMGPSGIGAATLYSSIVGCAMALAISWQGRAGEAGELERAFIPNGPIIRNILSIGWPAGALQLGWNFASLIIFAILGKLEDGGVAATAAITNGLRIEAGLFMPVFALNMAAGVLVGQALGNRDVTGAKRAGWRVSWAAVVVITLASLPIFVFSRELGALLSPDPNVIEATHLYLRINMLSQPFMALSLCLGGGLQGAGDTHGVSKVVLASLYGVRLPLALALAFGAGWGANGVWLAMTGSMVIQGVWMSARFKRGEWTSKEFAA